MPFDQRQRHPRRHQRIQPKASRCHFIFVLMLASCWLLSSSVVQAVLTEDDIIDKELTWAAMARKVHLHGFSMGAPGTRGSSKTRRNDGTNGNDVSDVNDDNFEWTRDAYDWTQQQRQQDRIHLQAQQEEQPRQRQRLRSRQRRTVEMPYNRNNLRDRSDAPLPR
jgi:hypothetical protein